MYFAECLRIITENTAKMFGGSCVSVSLHDLLNPKQEEEKTPQEIIDGIQSKIDKMNNA